MAARQITPATLGAILAAVAMLGVLSYLGLLFMGTKAEPVADASHKYDTQILATELNPSNAKSVFLLTVPLFTPTSQTSGGVQYNDNELGKSDITQVGK